MPRHTDPKVEGRILEAARRLWHKGGEDALSMRAVAKAARTNTPAVYRRFNDREDILRALVESFQAELFRSFETCRSVREILDCLLEFAFTLPREYELMTSGLLGRVTKSRPNVEFVILKLTEWLGGTAAGNRSLVMALWSMTHGLIMLKSSGTLLEQDFPAARAVFYKSVDILVENRRELSPN